MGIISDTFRTLADVYSGSGIHRFSAWGKDAEKYIKSTDSFFRIIDNDGYGLLIGVELNKLSSMHSVEHNIPAGVWDLLPSPTQEINNIYAPDEWFIQISVPYNNCWIKIQEICLRRNLITRKQLNNSTSMLFKLKQIIEVYKEEIIRDPISLFNL